MYSNATRDSFNGRTSVFQTENGGSIPPSRTSMFRGVLYIVCSISIVLLSGTALLILLEEPESAVISYVRPVSPIALEQPLSASSTPEIATTTSPVPTPTVAPIKTTETSENSPVTPAPAPAKSEAPPPENQVRRIDNPYAFSPLSVESLNEQVRKALVNIYCETTGGPLGSISGSGIIIDQRGVILTNAHVAQYVLLSTQPEIGLSCSIRTGAPAQAVWKAEMLYMPASWVRDHAEDIKKSRPKGTGEDDYALLLITKNIHASPLPNSFPFIPIDTREAIGFTSDSVLLAGYPAEFSGSGSTRSNLYPSSVVSTVGDLLTFSENSVDLISLGSVVLAQSGSSGGAAINFWGRLVGLISTKSEGATTADRELRAITLSYINRDMRTETGESLLNLLENDVVSYSAGFMKNHAPQLAKQIIAEITQQ